MPLPLGHTAIGWAVHETAHKTETKESRLGLFIFITVLANLPDLDILFGLLLTGDGAAFHRGPTHSLLFALMAGYLASKAWHLWRHIPRLGFTVCALVIFSHVMADLFFTSAPVSIFWPLEVSWSPGHKSWLDVVNVVIFQSIQDFIIAAVVVTYLFILRQCRRSAKPLDAIFSFARKRTD